MGLGRKQLATKEDLRYVKDKMTAKNQVETLAISVEESGRDMVQHLLEYWGHKCAAEEVSRRQRMQVISTTTQAQSAVGEANVRACRRDVEKAFERMWELQNRCPKRFPEMLVPLDLAADLLAMHGGRGSSKYLKAKVMCPSSRFCSPVDASPEPVCSRSRCRSRARLTATE
jgi:hypothetical protein